MGDGLGGGRRQSRRRQSRRRQSRRRQSRRRRRQPPSPLPRVRPLTRPFVTSCAAVCAASPLPRVRPLTRPFTRAKRFRAARPPRGMRPLTRPFASAFHPTFRAQTPVRTVKKGPPTAYVRPMSDFAPNRKISRFADGGECPCPAAWCRAPSRLPPGGLDRQLW